MMIDVLWTCVFVCLSDLGTPSQEVERIAAFA